MYGMRRILSFLSLGAIAASSFAAFPALKDTHPQYRLPSGRIYRSRSRYTPGGANRNCGNKGISPKSVARAQRKGA